MTKNDKKGWKNAWKYVQNSKYCIFQRTHMCFVFFMFLLIFPVTACVFSHVWTTLCELNHMCMFRCDFRTVAKKSWFYGKNTWFYDIAGVSKSIKTHVFDNVQLLTWMYKKVHNILPCYEKSVTRYTPTLEPYACSFILYCINI